MWGDAQVTRFIGGRPSTREEAWARILRNAGHWTLVGFGYWVITDKEGRFVGEAGFADLLRDIQPPFAGTPEMGWVLAPWAHGRGYATEAVRAALDWAAGHFGPGRRVCMIDPGNAPSIRVAEKVGFRKYAETTYKGDPTLLYELR